MRLSWVMAIACPPQNYRRRRPELSVLYRALAHHFERFEQVYEERFESAFGFLRKVVQKSVFRFLDCGILEQGFCRLYCRECRRSYAVAFSCRQRCLCQKNGVPLFAAMKVDLGRYAMIDVCRNEDGSETEVCGVHFYGPAISSSTSGFGGAFGSIVQDLKWADGRVVARLKSSPGHDQKFESIDLSFDLSLP